MELLHERIKYIIDLMNLKQKDIAQKLEKDKTLVSKHLNGTRKITADALIIYAEFFGVDEKSLLAGTVEWEDSEYQMFTHYIPKAESLVTRRGTEPEAGREQRDTEIETDGESLAQLKQTLQGVFLGVSVASVAGLAVHHWAKKAQKNQTTSETDS